MAMLTTDQVTEIADTLEALGDTLRARNWEPGLAESVMTAASGNLVSIAAMRAPQPGYLPQPPYPYGPEDFRPGEGQSVPLQVTVTGGTRQEIEERAHAAGRQVFGEDAVLAVTLGGVIQGAGVIREGVTQYQCGAIVRQQEPLVTPR